MRQGGKKRDRESDNQRVRDKEREKATKYSDIDVTENDLVTSLSGRKSIPNEVSQLLI